MWGQFLRYVRTLLRHIAQAYFRWDLLRFILALSVLIRSAFGVFFSWIVGMLFFVVFLKKVTTLATSCHRSKILYCFSLKDLWKSYDLKWKLFSCKTRNHELKTEAYIAALIVISCWNGISLLPQSHFQCVSASFSMFKYSINSYRRLFFFAFKMWIEKCKKHFLPLSYWIQSIQGLWYLKENASSKHLNCRVRFFCTGRL